MGDIAFSDGHHHQLLSSHAMPLANPTHEAAQNVAPLSKTQPIRFPSSIPPGHKKHSGVFRCPQCQEGFHFQRYLHLHQRQIHDRLPVHHCPHCRNAFGTTKDVNDHIQKVHSEEKRPHSCHLCSCSFFSKVTLKQHINDLHLRKAQKCSECSFKTVYEGVLKKHMNDVHSLNYETQPLDMSYQGVERRTVGYLSLDRDAVRRD